MLHVRRKINRAYIVGFQEFIRGSSSNGFHYVKIKKIFRGHVQTNVKNGEPNLNSFWPRFFRAFFWFLSSLGPRERETRRATSTAYDGDDGDDGFVVEPGLCPSAPAEDQPAIVLIVSRHERQKEKEGHAKGCETGYWLGSTHRESKDARVIHACLSPACVPFSHREPHGPPC